MSHGSQPTMANNPTASQLMMMGNMQQSASLLNSQV
jgi:hypothetical protein